MNILPTDQWGIFVFDNKTDKFVNIQYLYLHLEDLQKLFDIPSDNPMYDTYKIDPHHIQWFIAFTDCDMAFDFENMNYLLERILEPDEDT